MTARALSAIVQDEPVAFPAPVVPGLSEQIAESRWRELAYAFSLQDPREFPPIGREAFSADEIESIKRFIEAVGELGQSIVLNGGSRLTINLTGDLENEVDAEFPDNENIRGFSVLFRQCYSDNEAASFKAVRTAIGRAARATTDGDYERRLDLIKVWRRAHGKLREDQLEMHVLRALYADGKVSENALELHRDRPAQIISLYNYGEVIHFGAKRQELANLIGAGQFESAWSRMQFLFAVTGLSHFYVGFSLLATAALK